MNKRKMATLKNETFAQRAKLKEHGVQRRERRQNEKCIERGVDTRERGQRTRAEGERTRNRHEKYSRSRSGQG